MRNETKLTTAEKFVCASLLALGALTIAGTDAPNASKEKLLEAGYAEVVITGKTNFFKCIAPIRPTFTAAVNGQKISGYMCGPTDMQNPHANIVVEKREPLPR